VLLAQGEQGTSLSRSLAPKAGANKFINWVLAYIFELTAILF
jgi:hypothetical protein